jgi:release factor glutamine methyltransferase
MTVREAIQQAAAAVALRDAETLLLHRLGRDRAWLLAHPDDVLAPDVVVAFGEAVARRAAHEPLQYITGQQEFYGLMLEVTRDTLIPRPETELLVEAVELWATRFHDGRTLHIADVGTGTGAIAIALATHLAGVRVTAVDIANATLQVARANATRLGCADRITFREGDLLAGFAENSLDAVVSNPPYVPAADAATMQPEVVGWEPHTALFSGADGLEHIRRLIAESRTRLRAGGLLAFEFGFGQRDDIAALLKGWNDVRFVDDYAGIPRHALAIR